MCGISGTYGEGARSDALDIRLLGLWERVDKVWADQHSAHNALKTSTSQHQLRLSLDEGRDLFISVPRLSRRIGGGQGDLKGVSLQHGGEGTGGLFVSLVLLSVDRLIVTEQGDVKCEGIEDAYLLVGSSVEPP